MTLVIPVRILKPLWWTMQNKSLKKGVWGNGAIKLVFISPWHSEDFSWSWGKHSGPQLGVFEQRLNTFQPLWKVVTMKYSGTKTFSFLFLFPWHFAITTLCHPEYHNLLSSVLLLWLNVIKLRGTKSL